MLTFGFWILSVAVALGAALAAGRVLRAAAAHGLAGLTGLGALALALVLGRSAFGGPFATDAVVLTGAAGATGAAIYALRRLRRPRPGLLLALHATAGGTAYLLLSGFVFGR